MSKRPIDLALRDLVAVGVVRRRDIGNQSLYQLNPHNALARHAVFKLFKGERTTIDEFFDTLRDLVEVDAESPPLWAGLFGSTAQATDQPDSDVDLAVVVGTETLVDPMLTRLSERSRKMFDRRFGRVLSPVVISQPQLRRLAAASSPLIEALRSARQVAGTESDFDRLLDDPR
ncbi:MAG: nucleotidyltransferase domain-containing protein [Gemmatimonadota bacterium]